MSGRHWHSGETDTGELHVWPCRDSIEHEPTDDCVCAPKIALAKGEEGEDVWSYTHSAVDGRPGPGEPHDHNLANIPQVVVSLDLRLLVGGLAVAFALGQRFGRRRR